MIGINPQLFCPRHPTSKIPVKLKKKKKKKKIFQVLLRGVIDYNKYLKYLDMLNLYFNCQIKKKSIQLSPDMS